MIKAIRGKLNKDINLLELVKGSTITFFLKMFGMLLGYILIYLISKKNGADGVGFYYLFNQVLTVLSMVLGLGMNISVLRFVGQFNNAKDNAKMHLLYGHIFNIVTPLCIVTGIVLFFGANELASVLGKSEEYVEAFRAVGFVLPFFGLNQISVEFIRGLKKLQISEFVRSVTRPLVMVIIILAFWNTTFSNIEILYMFVLASIINSLFSGATIQKELRKIPKDKTADFSYKELLVTSAPMTVTCISSTLMSASPVFFLQFFTTQSDVGVFSVSFRIAQFVSMILVIVNTISAPKFAELYWKNEIKELKIIVRQSSMIIFWISFIISVFLIVFSKPILNMFGQEFTTGSISLIVIIISQIINAATGSVSLFLNMTGNQRILRNIILITTVLMLIGYFVLVPLYGVNGAAIVYTGGVIILNVTAAYYVYKKLGVVTFYLPFFKPGKANKKSLDNSEIIDNL